MNFIDTMNWRSLFFDFRKPSKRDVELPVIPPRPSIPYDPNPAIARCGACNLIIRQVMHYSCSQSNCPIFPQIRL